MPYYFKLPWIVTAWADRYAKGQLQLSDLAPDIRADYVKRPAVLTAWVDRHSNKAAEYQASVLKQLSKDGIYIPMPISVRGATLRVPTRDDFAMFAEDQPTILAVTGPGGSGKSVFAGQLCAWALEGFGNEHRKLLPVFVGHPTSDLAQAVKEQIRPIIDYDEDLDDALLSSLIRWKWLLIVMDSLSEWDDAQRTYIEEIRGKMAIGALVLTSRRPVDFPNAIIISISGLDSGSMLYFRQQYLKVINLTLPSSFETALDHGLVDMKARWFAGADPTCLLVRLYIDDAVASARTTPEQLAENAPDVILRYVRRVAGISDEDFLMGLAKEAAREALSFEFVPRSVSQIDLVAKLQEALKDQPVKAGLERLVDSGILRSRIVAGATTLEFANDPVAEFLASIRYCEVHKRLDAAAWAEFVQKVGAVQVSASGFVFALQTSLSSYRTTLNLPSFMQF